MGISVQVQNVGISMWWQFLFLVDICEQLLFGLMGVTVVENGTALSDAPLFCSWPKTTWFLIYLSTDFQSHESYSKIYTLCPICEQMPILFLLLFCRRRF